MKYIKSLIIWYYGDGYNFLLQSFEFLFKVWNYTSLTVPLPIVDSYLALIHPL